MKCTVRGVALAALAALLAGCGDAPSADGDYPSDPQVIAVYFAESATCKEARAYVAAEPDHPEFETCEFAGDYIARLGCRVSEYNDHVSGDGAAMVELLCVPRHGDRAERTAVYLSKESGRWKVVSADSTTS